MTHKKRSNVIRISLLLLTAGMISTSVAAADLQEIRFTPAKLDKEGKSNIANIINENENLKQAMAAKNAAIDKAIKTIKDLTAEVRELKKNTDKHTYPTGAGEKAKHHAIGPIQVWTEKDALSVAVPAKMQQTADAYFIASLKEKIILPTGEILYRLDNTNAHLIDKHQ